MIPLRSRLPPRGALAVSSDGDTIYYAESGAVYAQARSGPPRRLAEGDTITLRSRWPLSTRNSSPAIRSGWSAST